MESLNPADDEDIVRRLVGATADKSLEPWMEALASAKAIQEALDDACFGFRDDLRARAHQAAAEALEKIRPGATYQEKRAIAAAAVQAVKQAFQYSQIVVAVASAAVARLEGANGEERNEAGELLQSAFAGVTQGANRRELERTAAEALVPLRAAIEERLAQERAAIEEQRARERAEKEQKEQATAKQRIIENALNETFSYLLMIKRSWNLEKDPATLASELKPVLRAKLEKKITGNESRDEITQLVRRLIRRALGIR